jgi:hypothetical protein
LSLEVPRSKFFQHPEPFVARQLRLIRQRVDDRRIETIFEDWEQLRANSITRDGDIVIRRIVDEWHLALGQKCAKFGPTAVEQRANCSSIAWMHAGESPRPCTAQEPKQDRFRLIVTRVSECHGVGGKVRAGTLEEFVTRVSGRMLDRASISPRSSGDIFSLDEVGPPELLRERPAEHFVVLGVIP